MHSESQAAHKAQSHATAAKMGGDRSFGLVFASILAVLGIWPMKTGGNISLWVLGVAAVFLVMALTAPRMLHPLNLMWFRFGLLLQKIVTPVAMALLFFVVVTPMGLIVRAFASDPLRLKRPQGLPSYWIERQPPGPTPETMKNQF